MTAGVPGGDAEIAENDDSLGLGVDEVILRWLAILVRVGAFAAFPPLYLYDDPVRGFWHWRKIYAVFLAGTALVFLPSVFRLEFAPLLLFPVFHLIVFALLAEVFVAMAVPSSVAVSIPAVPSLATAPVPVLAVAVGLCVVLAVVVVVQRGVSLPFSDSDEEPEYNVLMTEIWKSGGKHD